MLYPCKGIQNPPTGSWDIVQTIRFWLKFSSLSRALTLEIRSRSPNIISSSSRSIVISMQIWLKSADWFMRCHARKKLSCQLRRDPHQKQYVSLPFGATDIFSLERLCSKTAPIYCTVSLASMSVPLIKEFKADLDEVPVVHQQAVDDLIRYDRSYLVTSWLRTTASSFMKVNEILVYRAKCFLQFYLEIIVKLDTGKCKVSEHHQWKASRYFCTGILGSCFGEYFIVFVHHFVCKSCKIHVRREKFYKPAYLVVTYNSRLHDVTSANQPFPLSMISLTHKVTGTIVVHWSEHRWYNIGSSK